MRGYGQFCPVAVASEVFAERWTPLILREMFCGSRRFKISPRHAPDLSLAARPALAATLEDTGVIESIPLRADGGASIG